MSGEAFSNLDTALLTKLSALLVVVPALPAEQIGAPLREVVQRRFEVAEDGSLVLNENIIKLPGGYLSFPFVQQEDPANRPANANAGAWSGLCRYSFLAITDSLDVDTSATRKTLLYDVIMRVLRGRDQSAALTRGMHGWQPSEVTAPPSGWSYNPLFVTNSGIRFTKNFGMAYFDFEVKVRTACQAV